MQVEFVGLPGCGKTTLVSALEKRLAAEGFRAQGLRNAAKAAIAGVQNKIGFLRQRGERTSLYGSLIFAHKNPELYQWMFKLSNKDFVALIWGMEALSQIGILQEHGARDLIVLNDEGFLQRLSWNFIELEDGPEIAEISRLIPDDFLTVHLTLDAAQAYGRTKGRKKGIPQPLKGTDDAEAITKFARYGVMLDRFVNERRSCGCEVFVVDAGQEPDAVLEEVLPYLRPFLPTPIPVSAKKLRRVKA
jgi:thymidylate kinase